MAKKKRSALPFQATRSAHSLEAAEDYTELIADLIKKEGEARTCRIADLLGISHVTAIRTLQRLERLGLLKTSRRNPVFLTSKGKKLAAYSRHRHLTLLSFFDKIGVPKKVSERDVEGIEHHVSPATLKVIEKFLKKQAGR